MSWAVDRETTREEDIAYCLLGIFDVNLPLIYGEGKRAFLRLQEKLLQESDDHTIFAWRASNSPNQHEPRGLFATSPNEFRRFSANLRNSRISFGQNDVNQRDDLARVWGLDIPTEPMVITNRGIRMTAKLFHLHASRVQGDNLILILNCCFDGDPSSAAGIHLKRQGEDQYVRASAAELACINPDHAHSVDTVYALASVNDNRNRHIDTQWTSSTAMKTEWLQADWMVQGKRIAAIYKHSFYLPRRFFTIDRVHGSYSLSQIWATDAGGFWHSFLFSPSNHSDDLVMPTHPRFKTTLIFTTENKMECILIFLGMSEYEMKLNHQLDAVCVSSRRTANLRKRFIQGDFEASEVVGNRTRVSREQVHLKIFNGLSEVRIRMSPMATEGIPMQHIIISREWVSDILFLIEQHWVLLIIGLFSFYFLIKVLESE